MLMDLVGQCLGHASDQQCNFPVEAEGVQRELTKPVLPKNATAKEEVALGPDNMFEA